MGCTFKYYPKVVFFVMHHISRLLTRNLVVLRELREIREIREIKEIKEISDVAYSYTKFLNLPKFLKLPSRSKYPSLRK